jgi:copper chaperone CopZ
MGNRKFLLAAVFIGALALASATAFLGEPGTRYPQQAEFAVQNLTCAACVGNLQRALNAVEGIGKTNVNVLSGRARVEYDPELIDVGRIAAAITAAGYPAIHQQSLTAEALQALQMETQRLSADYAGRIGGRLVAKGDFEKEVERLRASLPPQHAQMPADSLKKLAWQNVVQREILLAEADRRQMVVQDDEVAAEIERMRGEGADFQDLLLQFEEENLVRRVKEGLLIDRLVEEQMNKGDLPRDQARMELERWYRNLSGTTSVEVFDPALRSGHGGGCGPGCC